MSREIFFVLELVAIGLGCLLALAILVLVVRAIYRAVTHVYGYEYRQIPKGQLTSRLNLHPYPLEKTRPDEIHGLRINLVKVDGKGIRMAQSKVRTLLLGPGEHTLILDLSYGWTPSSGIRFESDGSINVERFYLHFSNLSSIFTCEAEQEYCLKCRFVRDDGSIYTPLSLGQALEDPERLNEFSRKNIMAMRKLTKEIGHEISDSQVRSDEVFSPQLIIETVGKIGTTSLWEASGHGHTHTVKLLLKEGADVNVKRTDDGTTALLEASAFGHKDVVKLLLKKGADVNIQTTDTDWDLKTIPGITALWVASANGHTNVVKLLLKEGADVNIKTSDGGTTALWVASANGYTDIVKLLLKENAEVNMKNLDDGLTALKVAKKKRHTAIVQLLEKAGAKE